jgi:FHS family L-fucose permease-like MFS transporter
MEQQQTKTNYPALYTLIIVFSFGGSLRQGTVFLYRSKNYFHLDQFQSQLIDFAFYTAYYIGALLLFIFSSIGGKDLVGKWGYKRVSFTVYFSRPWVQQP